ncbi:MAG: hypothetical protein CMJ26_08260 [Phycisphaerae bacterium]|nr:hypothetical protein [Phycisphaerae bacterium]
MHNESKSSQTWATYLRSSKHGDVAWADSLIIKKNTSNFHETCGTFTGLHLTLAKAMLLLQDSLVKANPNGLQKFQN